jgi:hypothetical protein
MADLDLQDMFSYHAPEGDDPRSMTLSGLGRALFRVRNLETCPASADRSAAIRKVREAVMTANASIALKGRYDKK